MFWFEVLLELDQQQIVGVAMAGPRHTYKMQDQGLRIEEVQ